MVALNGLGDGDGDFFDKFNGCCESAMSTCNSIIFGVGLITILDVGEDTGELIIVGGDFRCKTTVGGTGDVDEDAQ